MDESAPRWAAVVVNYEAGPLLAACIRSLLADASAGEPELVVVDNGSRDGSVAALVREFPSVRVLTSETNLGYAGGVNRGAAVTRAPVVAVVERGRGGGAGHGGRDARTAGRRARPRRRRPGDQEPRRLAVPLGPHAFPRRATRWVMRCSASCARRTASPAGTASSTWIPPGPVTWSGSRAPRCGSAVRHFSRSGDGTSTTSCTWRTSTSAGASGGSAGGWPTSPRAPSCTSRRSAPTGTRTA